MSMFTRAAKRIASRFHDAVGNQVTAENLIIEVAVERLSEAANKAIKRARRGELQLMDEQFDLTSTESAGSWHGRRKANRPLIDKAAKPIIERCEKNGVKLTVEAKNGDSYSDGNPASILAWFRPMR